MEARDGFWQLLRAEWTKLRSVNRWAIAMGVAVALIVGFGVFLASVNRVDYNTPSLRPFVVSFDNRPVADAFTFVHQPMAGNGSVIARVASQADSHEWATAGVMIKADLRAGSSYAALAVTPRNGLRLQADFATDREVGSGGAPRWLKLTRAGATVTGYESSDGATWREVGAVAVPALPATTEVGLFVSSPGLVIVKREGGISESGERPTDGQAIFDDVRLDPAPTGPWRADVPEGSPVPKDGNLVGTLYDEANGVFTVYGSGTIGHTPMPDDPVEITLAGVLLAMMALIPVGALYATSEYRRGMIRTTLALSRGGGRVLAAKSVVLGVTTFGLGLVATVSAFLLAQPILRSNGYSPPAYPYLSLVDPPVLRAVVGTAGLLALMAVFGLALGMVLRRSAGAITLAIVLVILPVFVSAVLPLEAARWLMYLTPTGGLAIQRAQPPSPVLAEAWSAINPWLGLSAVGAYTAVALVGAYALLRRRDA
jgi:hypothetical protein